MNTKGQIRKIEKSLDIMQSITRAFEHTATQKMQINKKELATLNNSLGETKQTYFNAKISIVKDPQDATKIMRTSMRRPSKQRIVILVSSEPAYYGHLLAFMAAEFIKEVVSANVDAVIVGLPGKEEVDKRSRGRIKYKYFDFNDDKPNWQVISKLSSMVINYEEIIVIFAKFRSILTQDVIKEDLGKTVRAGNATEVKKYRIVPDNKSALSYLEQQIVTNQLLQKMYENGLSKGAIRVRILEIGEIAQRLSETLEKFEKLKRKFGHEINNRKLANLYSSRSVWESRSMFTVYR